MDENPKCVLLPTTISLRIGKRRISEKLMRLCYFLRWNGRDAVKCQDTGILLGKSGRIYTNFKHRFQEYIFPAERAVFIFEAM